MKVSINELMNQIDKYKMTEVEDSRRWHLYEKMKYLHKNNIPGDLVETGIYKGGTSMVMAYANQEFGMNKTQWLVDSFEGCPDPEETEFGKHPRELHRKGDFTYPLELVKHNFEFFDLWSDNIKVLKGWFKDTLPNCDIREIALLRFDGDLYSSTMEVLTYLYPKVVKGGVVIIDDYCIEACKDAVDEYRTTHSLEILPLTLENTPAGGDVCGAWWIKE